MGNICALANCGGESVAEFVMTLEGGRTMLPICEKHKEELIDPGIPIINLRPVLLELYGGQEKTARLRVEDGRLIREEEDHGSQEKEA